MSNWFKCDPTDFLDGLETCDSSEQVAVYVACIFRMYASRGPIPNNPASIAPFAKMGPTKCRKMIAELLDMGKLELVGDRLFNARVRGEIGHQKEVSAARAKAGKVGGRPAKKSAQTDGKPAAESPRNGVGDDSYGGLRQLSDEEMAENSQTPKANAFTDREIDRKNPPSPPTGGLTDFDRKMRAEFAEFAKTLPPKGPDPKPERIEPLRKPVVVVDIGPVEEEATSRELTQFVMRSAAMVMPPHDIAMVGGWLKNGFSEKMIREVVARLSANAKGQIKSCRYFDAEIRAQHQALIDDDLALAEHFNRIGERARERDAQQQTQH